MPLRSLIEERTSPSHLLFDGLVLDRRILSTTVRKKLSRNVARDEGQGEKGRASLFLLEAIYFGQYGFPDVLQTQK